MQDINSMEDVCKALGTTMDAFSEWEKCPYCGHEVSLFGTGLATMIAGANHAPTHAGCYYTQEASDEWRAARPHYNPANGQE